MKPSRIVAVASLVAVTALLVGVAVNHSIDSYYFGKTTQQTQTPAPVSSASLDPVVVTAKR